MSRFSHETVLLCETVDLLNVKQSGLYIDCTTGGGGHSLRIAEKGGSLVCFDADATAIVAAKERLAEYSGVRYINTNFAEMADYDIDEADGILMDLGVSSYQLDTADRGFSFHENAPLDMRMNPAGGLSAFDVVNDYPADKLMEILYEYGEEKFARGIVNSLIKARADSPVKTTGELAEIIRNSVPQSVRNAKNPCRKTFQAIRIEVNDELGSLNKGLREGFRLLKKSGRFAVITFHSLEDRIVKKTFAEFTAGCDCPKTLPICVCGKTPSAVSVTRKPVTPSESEIQQNRRSRSAKLRVIEKL